MRWCIASLLIIISLLTVHADVLVIGLQKQDLPVPFIMDNGEVIAPAAAALPTLGAQLTVTKNDFTLTTGLGNVIIMQAESRTVTVDGNKLTLPAAPKLIDDKAWLPLTSLTPWLGVNSHYNADSNTLTLTPWLQVAVEVREGGVAIFARSVVPLSYRIEAIDDPMGAKRVIYDFIGTDQHGNRLVDINKYQVQAVRQSQHNERIPPCTRMVLDIMDKKVPVIPDVSDNGRLLTISAGAPVSITPPTGFMPAGSSNAPAANLIVLDAGHGGRDSGAVGPNGVREKDVALDIVKRTDTLLRAAGYKTMLTRSDDTYVSLPKSTEPVKDSRVAKANDAKATLFISVHCNAYSVQSAKGTEVYYYTAQSSKLARAIHDAVQEKLGRVDRGINPEHDFVVITKTNMPSVLLETAFISNPTEEELLNSEEFRQRAAEGLFLGIKRYLGK